MKSGYTPLHQAASEGHVVIVNLLLKSGAIVDAQDDLQGNTPLHEAAWKGFSQTIEALVRHKANPNVKNKGGFSALHLSCQQGHNQSSRILLMAGCKANIKNNYGDTPLHTAARYGHAGVARILISAFCNVSQVNKNGDTPLHITAAMGRRKLTKILLESGCNITIKNKQGETAMDIALRKQHFDVQEIIVNPPPARPITVEIVSKKREKASSSLGSNSQEKALKDRYKKSKMHGSSKSVQFIGQIDKPKKPPMPVSPTPPKPMPSHDSPYGCPQSPDMAEFPKPKLNSLPPDPLRKGEQYFIDLAGNIKKGPLNKSNACVCKPLFEKVEAKLDNDKQELKDHIDCRHDDLNAKICSLEKKTRNQLVTLNETVKEKLACERQECIQRIRAVSLV